MDDTLFDIFVSYAAADAAWVRGYLLDALHEAGLQIHTESDFEPGVPHLVELEYAIQHSRRILIVISPSYLADQAAEFTNILGQTLGLETSAWLVIPLLVHPVSQMPLRLQMLTTLDATTSETQHLAIERLRTLFQVTTTHQTEKPPCPYPGMSSFDEADRERYPFFGRETEIQGLMLALRQYPFITVIGPSGCGKSSFVSAGVIPALKRSTLFDSQNWLVIPMRPGTNPLTTLLARLPESYRNDALNDSPVNDSEKLTSPNTAEQQILLIVDQFEETFTLGQSESIAFQRELLRLIHTPKCYVILTVRADFFSELISCPLWSEIQPHRLELPPLNAAALRSAIVRPAETVNVFLDPALVETLISDSDAEGEPGILPFVQETMVLLWDRLERRFLPRHAYDSLIQAYSVGNNLSQGQTGLQVAMALRADQAVANLSRAQQVLAWRIFTRLIQFGEGHADTRRQQTISNLRSIDDDRTQFDQTLNYLAQRRLLTLSGSEDEKDQTADLAHEALIGGWPRLQDWIKSRRKAEQTRRRLETKATEWVHLGRGSGALLDEMEMAEADVWLTGQEASELGCSADLSALIQKSREAIRDAELARRAARRRRQLAIGLLCVGLLLGLVALVYRESVRQSTGAPLTTISAGSATLGVAEPRPELGEQRLRLVDLEQYQIERFEVTNSEYRACVGRIGPVRLGPCREPELLPERYTDAHWADYPVVGVTPEQAITYCSWLGRRLPTAIQWERAARGDKGRKWPWGNTTPTPRQVQLLLEDFPSDVPTDTVPVNSMLSGATPDTLPIYHMADNVMEWVVVQSSPSTDEFGIMGGAFDSYFDSLSAITLSGSENAGESTGFRCAAD